MSDEGDDSWLPRELLEGAHGLDAELLDIQRKLLRARLFGAGSGVRLAGYELLDEIGRGAMGVVYAARDPRLDRKVALKLVQDGDEPELRRRLVREARAMAKLDHPNVVPIYEIHETPKLAFIVMALVEGETLRSWQEAAPRSQAELLAAYLAAGQGLAAAHQKDLVHRDFKPDNVMISSAGEVRVMDFGLAQVDGAREQSFALEVQTGAARGSWNGARALTQTGALIGTPAYMAPEQLSGQGADAASDQFGFCVALYEALYGERPFAEGSFEEMREAVAAGLLRTPVGGSEVSEALRAVLIRGLEPSPDRRFSSMDSLLDALREAAAPGADDRYASETELPVEPATALELTDSSLSEATPRGERTEAIAREEQTEAYPGDIVDSMDRGAVEVTEASAPARRGSGERPLPIQFNGYELLDKLGEGGMGEVWSARRRGLGDSVKRVAIKLIAPRHYEDPYLRELFLTEARLSMLLNNSRIVQVFDVGEVGETCYMAMEWVDGLNLAELTRALRKQGRGLTHGQAAFVLGELLRALSYAHEPTAERDHPLIHRDISPQNVMLSVTGEVKVMDFGIATLMSDDTSGGGVKGKPRYMPPEQFVDRVRRPTIDLFALGAIFHELVDNQVFRAEVVDGGELYGMIVTGRYPALRDELPPELEVLRAGLLEPDPERRIGSAREALRLLRAWVGYRDHSHDLEVLVRELSGRGSLERKIADVARISGRHAALSGSGSLERSPSASLGRASTMRSDSERGEVSGEPAKSRRRWVYAALLLLPLVGLGGYALWGGDDGERSPELAVAPAPTDVEPRPQPTVEPESTPDAGSELASAGAAESDEAAEETGAGSESSGAAEGEEQGEVQEVQEAEAGEAGEAGSGGASSDKPANKRGGGESKTSGEAEGSGAEVEPPPAVVSVIIEQHGQFCVDVRLGTETVRNVEKKPRTVERAPGSLACAVRVCGEEGWHQAGRVSLAAGSSPTLYIDWPRQSSEPQTVELR